MIHNRCYPGEQIFVNTPAGTQLFRDLKDLPDLLFEMAVDKTSPFAVIFILAVSQRIKTVKVKVVTSASVK